MQTYSGCLGIVIELDNETKQRAIRLAKSLEDSRGCEYRVSMLHITLYHGNFTNIPAGKIGALIYEIQFLLKKRIQLCYFSPYGGKFIFWDIADDPVRALIHDAHTIVIETLSPYLEPAKEAPAEKEQLQLSEAERENIRHYGHPLVGSLYRPHVTLIYNLKGVNGNGQCDCTAKVMGVSFAEIGDYGSIKSILFSIR